LRAGAAAKEAHDAQARLAAAQAAAEQAKRKAEEALRQARAMALDLEQRVGRPADAKLTREAPTATRLREADQTIAQLRDQVAQQRAEIDQLRLGLDYMKERSGAIQNAFQSELESLSLAALREAQLRAEQQVEAVHKAFETRARQQAEAQQQNGKGSATLEQQLERLAAEIERLKQELARSKAGGSDVPKKN
jgi:uncharacterized coiled-coil protein SlyX